MFPKKHRHVKWKRWPLSLRNGGGGLPGRGGVNSSHHAGITPPSVRPLRVLYRLWQVGWCEWVTKWRDSDDAAKVHRLVTCWCSWRRHLRLPYFFTSSAMTFALSSPFEVVVVVDWKADKKKVTDVVLSSYVMLWILASDIFIVCLTEEAASTESFSCLSSAVLLCYWFAGQWYQH